MKKILLIVALAFAVSACGPTLQELQQTIPQEPTHKLISINSFPAGAKVYMEGKYLGVTPLEVNIPLKYNFVTNMVFQYHKPEYIEDVNQKSEEQSSITFKFVKEGYEISEVVYRPTISFSPIIGGTRSALYSQCKNYNRQFVGCTYSAPEGLFAEMQPLPYMASVDTTIPAGESGVEVSRDTPGASGLEKTVIRWFFDSEPRGARVFWRVISSIPAQVKNTNESYLGTTPFEETRSFNILGLTYENSRDVQIEIKITKPGYMDQTKRFNVRQAIDQMEISSFYDLVPKE